MNWPSEKFEITFLEKESILWVKRFYYHHECKRNYLHEEDKSTNIIDPAVISLIKKE